MSKNNFENSTHFKETKFKKGLILKRTVNIRLKTILKKEMICIEMIIRSLAKNEWSMKML